MLAFKNTFLSPTTIVLREGWNIDLECWLTISTAVVLHLVSELTRSSSNSNPFESDCKHIDCFRMAPFMVTSTMLFPAIRDAFGVALKFKSIRLPTAADTQSKYMEFF